MITYARLKEQLRYEKKSGLFFWKVSKQKVVKGELAGCIGSSGYVVIQIDNKTYTASRLAWLYVTGHFPKLQIDHINGNRLDDSWKNLRELSQELNIQNQRTAHAQNIAGLLGVSAHKSGFKAEIKSGGKRIYIGLYKTAEKAHAAYVKTKRILHEACTL